MRFIFVDLLTVAHFFMKDLLIIGVRMSNHSTKKYEPLHEKICPMPYANNKGADQLAHPHSLMSTFVVHCRDSIIHIIAKSKISKL